MNREETTLVKGKVDTSTDIHFSFKWSIEKFCFGGKRRYRSPSFKTGHDNNASRWNLILETEPDIYDNQHSSYKKQHPLLKLYLQDSYDDEIEIETWCTIDLNKTCLSSSKPKILKCQIGKEHNISADNDVMSQQVEFGTLMIKVQIVDPDSTKSGKVDDQLIDDLTSLWKTGMHSDLTITTQDQRQHRVHRSVLAIRCPKFFNMIKKKKAETNGPENEIEIMNIEGRTLETFLKYLYTGYLDSWKYLEHELVDVAVEYGLHSLKDRCLEALERSLDLSDVLETFALADKHKTDSLKASTLKMITENIHEIRCSQSMKEFKEKHPHLVEEITVHSEIIRMHLQYFDI